MVIPCSANCLHPAVTIVGPVAYQPRGRAATKRAASVSLHQRHFAGTGARHVDAAGRPCPSARAMCYAPLREQLRAFAAFRFPDAEPPSFRWPERAVDEPFVEVAPAERDRIRSQAMGDVGEDTSLDRVLEAPMTGLVGRIVVRQVLPAVGRSTQ